MTKGLKCCGKEMEFEQSYFNGEDGSFTLCLECGSYTVLKTGQLDEEELENEREQRRE